MTPPGTDPRAYSILSREFIGDADNNVKAVRTVEINVGADGRFQEVAGSEKEWPADLVILAMGFRHTEHAVTSGLQIELGAHVTAWNRTEPRATLTPARHPSWRGIGQTPRGFVWGALCAGRGARAGRWRAVHRACWRASAG